MVKELVHDPILLAVKSEEATIEDMQTATDLMDTLKAHKETCVGMAANMIGVMKRIIAFIDNGKYMMMFNPEIVKCEKPYKTAEGCLSLIGDPRPVERYRMIRVRWQNEKFETRVKNFTDMTAQIIQHEIDHCNGVLI